MHNTSHLIPILAAFITLASSTIDAHSQSKAPPPDLITFASGVLPVSIGGSGPFKTGMTHAIALIDGNPVKVGMTPKPGTAEDVLEIVYALPAPTRFTRFAVPDIVETPSPSQTFFRSIEVLGAASGADGPYAPLASGTLDVHPDKGMETELVMATEQPEVLWVKLRLSGGIKVERDKTFFEFSEIIGNGVQQTPSLSERFSGVWKGRGVDIELAQEGPTVTGCYDRKSPLAGTVEGNVLRAIGENSAGIPSQFVAIVGEDGALRALRSTNGAPFKPYDGEVSKKEPVCLAPETVSIGCGSVVHGIGFNYDSDVIRPESRAIIEALNAGLKDQTSERIAIIGHSSSEGAADYNRDLSQRRAQSVVAALTELGLDPARLTAAGRGEDEPIASNDDEAGRSLNRRVEIECAG